MIVSRKHKFAFVHIPKTGGTSITAMLKPYLGPGPKGGKGWQGFYHIGRMHGGVSHFPKSARYFKFAFVRNPWDWLVSLYLSAAIKAYIGYKPASWDLLIKLLSKRKHSVRCQSAMLMIKNKIAVDYIARFENFNWEARYIFDKKLGLKYKRVRHRVNRRRQKHYTQWYNENAVRVVGKLFKRDIKLFGYKFGV